MNKDLLLLTVLIIESIAAYDQLETPAYYKDQLGRKITQEEINGRVAEMKAEGWIEEVEEDDAFYVTPAGNAWFKANWG